MHLCLTVDCITSSLHFCSTVCLFFYQFNSMLISPPPPPQMVEHPCAPLNSIKVPNAHPISTPSSITSFLIMAANKGRALCAAEGSGSHALKSPLA